VGVMLESYLNFGGGLLAVSVIVTSGLTLLIYRAPTELIASFADQIRLKTRASASTPMILGESAAEFPDAAERRREAGEARKLRIELREAPARDRTRKAEPKPRGSKGGYKLP